MEQKQLDTFRQTLISLRDDIEQLTNYSREAAGTVALDQSKVGRLSRMDALQAQQMAQETARRRQLQLQQIDSALRRMDDYLPANLFDVATILDCDFLGTRALVTPARCRRWIPQLALMPKRRG